MQKDFNFNWGERVPEGGVELENKVLYQYMKDNETWWTEFDEDRKECIYHNPINTPAYGLLFHKEEEWLIAVLNKLQRFFDERELTLNVIGSHMPASNEYCITVVAQNEKLKIDLAHQHSHSANDGLRKCLVLIVKYLTTEYN